MAPSFTENAFGIAPPPGLRPPRNGFDYDNPAGVLPLAEAGVYDPATTEVDGDMGALPAALVRRPERRRGNHPLDSFAALGPLAGELAGGQSALDVYAPLRALSEHGGFVVLMGVGLRRMTILHLAEERAGRTLFRRWAMDADGRPAMFATGGCSEGFDAFEPVIGPIAREIVVGSSRWRAFPAGEVVALAAAAIRANPDITHCDDPGCERCHDAVLGGPILAPCSAE
jgi:aminoglycoside 3-N-acetyltransferase